MSRDKCPDTLQHIASFWLIYVLTHHSGVWYLSAVFCIKLVVTLRRNCTWQIQLTVSAHHFSVVSRKCHHVFFFLDPDCFSFHPSKLPLVCTGGCHKVAPTGKQTEVTLLSGAEGCNLLLTDTLLSDESSGAQMLHCGELSLEAWYHHHSGWQSGFWRPAVGDSVPVQS